MINPGYSNITSVTAAGLLLVLSVFRCQAQSTGHDQPLISALMDPVKEGRFIDEQAWLINDNGDTLTYGENFAGKWLLIDYWTAGCAPCIKEFPVLNTFYQNTDHSQLEVITLSVDRKISRWKRARRKYHFDMPKLYAGWSPKNHFLAINYVLMQNQDGSERIVTLTPQYVLISPEGKIVDKNIPKPSSAQFESTINNYLTSKK
jgi:thiol-disulfide isomerase/thioredoxin